MQTKVVNYFIYLMCVGILFTSCCRDSCEVWEDSKSAGRHMSRGLRTMGGKHGDSRAVQCREDFMPMDDCYCVDPCEMPCVEDYAPTDYVPMGDQCYPDQPMMANYVSQQPRETPGDPGSPIPGIASFQDPNMNPNWSRVFYTIYFDYNSNLVKGQENLNTIHNIANYMRMNPGVYIFAAGHCDERGPEAYNLALGARRSNAVRNLLIQEGVNPNNVFTISYGKEQPIMYDHNEESWAQNRRVEFKIYRQY